ncbi:RNA methyltransferase [Spirochaetia bacterium]|nr:RNA methyltransferase [Spirochaetia bacterium]
MTKTSDLWTIVALCGVGAERVVSNELKKLELPIVDTGFGRVRFKADITGCYRALMGLRAADRVLWEAAVFPAEDFDALFEGIRAVPWERFIPTGMGLVVDKVRTNRSKLRGVTSIQGVVHKAAAERLCKAYHCARLPDRGLMAELRVYVEKDQVSALLDLAGEPLFKRGYRIEGGIAPLRETTAAALLFLANWRRKFPLYDPFCGSGTIVIEAAMYAWDMAPGLGRTFALSALVPADHSIERSVREAFLKQVDFTRTIRIYGSDADTRAVSIAKSNMIRAYELAAGKGVTVPGGSGGPGRGIRTEADLPGEVRAALPNLRLCAMEDATEQVLKAPGTADTSDQRSVPGTADETGYIITNPPYGIRLGEPEDAEAAYQKMTALGRNFPGWKLAVITDHPGFESHFGKKASSCREITNGAIRAYFYQYENL